MSNGTTTTSEPVLKYTPLEEIPKELRLVIQIRETLKQAFRSGKLKSIEYRKQQVLQLGYLIQDNVERFQKALAADLGRPVQESNVLEIASMVAEGQHTYKNVAKWAKTERAPFSITFAAMGPAIRKEAKGVVLIISPFNYPVWLSIGPMFGAIAAGNAVVLKPSELSVHTSALFAELFPKYLDNDLFRVVNGAIPETSKLLELQWDHSGGNVGRIVATAAAKHLTPVSLEVSKSPCVIDPKTDMKVAARRIMWGKTSNAGQTCIAPDYVLVPHDAEDKLIEAIKEVYHEFYPDGPLKSNSFSRIISDAHFRRIKGLLDDTKGSIVIGGETDAAQKFIAPTIVKDVTPGDSLMSQELFGPILPIIPVKSVDEAIEIINSGDHPLVIYVFTHDSKFKAHVFDNTQSGAAIANEALLHAGDGAHRGKYSFEMFTHNRATMDSPGWIDLIMGSRYPPYTVRFLPIVVYVQLDEVIAW
ncbi:NAD-aldehyde dehydrogenase [Rickenella mellea]|uniref:Aldehyde dehydrogenase n=1 Tax=Rickenella mellea TaxID=50990 RepID=A0A4Y7Q5N6_9AGAM|nr:NAD-aldehyde dehydrogenase [Rickenella mellea]